MFINKILILSSLLLITCQQPKNKKMNIQQERKKTEKKFEWRPTECAPHHYPAEIYQGSFIMDDDKYITIPNGATIDYGWGKSGSTWVTGEDFKQVPNSLKIIWLSYTENQFYYLDTSLPKQKMTELFEKGFVNRQGKQETYDDIAVGLAPGGAVSIWLLAAERRVEIGHYQAKKTEVDMKDFKPDGLQERELYIKHREENFSEETKQILKEGVPIGKWTAFRKRFLWKPVLKHTTISDIKRYKFLNEFYNGEFYTLKDKNISYMDDYREYPPSKRTIFSWYDNKNNRFGCKVYFDEKEVWTAYKKIFKNKEIKQAEMVFKIDKYNSNVDIFLKSDGDSIKIKKAKIKTYIASDN